MRLSRHPRFHHTRSAAIALAGLALVACAGCGADPAPPVVAPTKVSGSSAPTGTKPPARTSSGTPVMGFKVVNSYAHDPQAFTQGLLFHDGFLYESTGQVGESSVRRVELETGVVLAKRDVASPMFCEGLALVGDTLVQLTWQNNTTYLWDRETFASKGIVSSEGEGWGLAFDGTRLVKSDGTSRLVFLDSATYRPTGSITVRDGERPITQLNELEWYQGFILANVWMTNLIAKIDPDSGSVVAWIDLAGLIDVPPIPPTNPGNVLNGIAHDAATGRLFVTGKDWPRLFEIELVSRAD